MSRRLNGSIEDRGGGKYRLTVSGGTDHNGRRIRHRKTVDAKNEREAERELMLYLAQLEGDNFYEPQMLKFKDFAEKWLAEYGKANLAASTYRDYKTMLNQRIYPAIGHIPIAQVRPLHIIEFENSLRKHGVRFDGKPGGLSESTILYFHRVLSSIFETAVQWEMIKTNPVKRIKAPKAQRSKVKAYGVEETTALLEALTGEPLKWQAIVHLAVATGLRRGELLGLEWADVDFEKMTLDVNKASRALTGLGTFTVDPKTEGSKRLIAIPLETGQVLKDYRTEWIKQRMQVGDLWEGSERLWVTWNGKPMHPNSVTGWFSKFIKRHNLPHITFHGLRHTSATLLISKGLDVRSVSNRLGHSRTSTTLDIYTHALQTADKHAADIMEQLLTKTQ